MAFGLIFTCVSLYLIRGQREEITPQILHEAPDGAFPHRMRHNKALLTSLRFLPVILCGNILVILLQIGMAQSKRKLICESEKQHNKKYYSDILISAGQTLVQMILWLN